MRPSEVDFPVTFEGTIGLYRPADAGTIPSNTAVLFISSWGFEELCARKLWRLLAEELAAQGIASLRFDYPGTGDALDVADADAGLDIWHQSITNAAATLRSLSGTRHLLLISHGIGAALAWQTAETMDDVAGLAMMAPALYGRHWIREFMALSRIADHGLIEHAIPPTGPTMGEQDIPAAILDDIRAIDYRAPKKSPVPDVLLLARQGRSSETAFLEHLETLGVHTQSFPFDEYVKFTRDVLFSVQPRAAISALAVWAAAIAKRHQPEQPQLLNPARAVPAIAPEVLPLEGNGFSETPVRFGRDSRLYGILCQPLGPQRGATVMIVSTGYDRMSGWGRITANVCRHLAKAGIPAFRFDLADIADSPPQPDGPKQIIYNDCQLRDFEEAVSFLEARQLLPIVATGRCSGAYTAFKGAVLDSRIGAVVAVNVSDFYIDPEQDIDKLISASLQPLSSYSRKMRNGGFWRRVLQGEVDIRRGVRNLTRMAAAKAKAISLPVIVMLPITSKRKRMLLAEFGRIEAAGTRLSLIYSEGDIGVPTLESDFGTDGYLLKRFVDVDIDFMAGADHNLTTSAAREYWQNKLTEVTISLTADG